MKKLPQFLDTRRHIQKRYNEELHPIIERPLPPIQFSIIARLPIKYKKCNLMVVGIVVKYVEMI